MRKFFAGFLLVAVIGAVNFVPQSAEAIPAFARKFQLPCTMCHKAFPLLNHYGEKFKEQGFQNEAGGSYDGGETGKSRLDDKLVVEKDIYPLAFRVKGDIYTDQEDGATPDKKSKTSIDIPNELELILGGTLFKNVSYFGSVAFEVEDGEIKTEIEHLYAGFHNLTGDNTLNVRAGLMPINEWGQPGHGLLQKKVNIHMAKVADDGWTIGGAERAIEVYGRPGDGPFFYNIGLSNGVKGSGVENNSSKSLFGRLGLNIAHQEFGLLGYRGKNAEDGKAEENRFIRYGFDYTLDVGPAMIYGQYFLGHDKNPTFAAIEDRSDKDSKGYFINATVDIIPTVFAVAQFDYFKKKHDKDSRVTYFTPGIAYYPLLNLKTVVEYQFDLIKRDSVHTKKLNRFNIRIDFVF